MEAFWNEQWKKYYIYTTILNYYSSIEHIQVMFRIGEKINSQIEYTLLKLQQKYTSR